MYTDHISVTLGDTNNYLQYDIKNCRIIIGTNLKKIVFLDIDPAQIRISYVHDDEIYVYMGEIDLEKSYSVERTDIM